MSRDSLVVIAYKILLYLETCLKKDVDANYIKLREILDINDHLFIAVTEDLLDNGYLSGSIQKGNSGKIIACSLRLTIAGEEYLKDNSKMREIAGLIGKNFLPIINTAIAVASLL